MFGRQGLSGSELPFDAMHDSILQGVIKNEIVFEPALRLGWQEKTGLPRHIES